MSDALFGLPPSAVYPVAFLFGALWGSFLNVCIVRLPLGRSVVWPSSRCPACETPIRGYDNIPILSYLILRGRCRACKAPFSARYPLVELLVAMLTLAIVHRFGLSWTSLAYFLLSLGLVVATFVDLAHFIIPNEVTYLLVPVGLGLSFLEDATVTPLNALLGAVGGGGVLFGVAYAYRLVRGVRGLGGGDVKLLAAIGAFLGWKALPLVIFLSAAQGVVVGIIVYVARRGKPLEPSEGEVPATPAAATATSAGAAAVPTDGHAATPASGATVPAAAELLDEEDDGPPPGRLAIPFGPFLALSTFEVIFFGEAMSRALFGAVLF